MTRLPIPGQDDGTWGNLLNDFLAQSHDSNGSIKPDAIDSTQLKAASVTANVIADSSITSAKLAALGGTTGQVLTRDTSASAGISWLSTAGTPDATGTTKGLVKLAGDLGGTADVPTVPGLVAKVDKATTVTAGVGLTGGGDLTANRTIAANIGTVAGSVAAGNHTHVALAGVFPLSAYGFFTASVNVDSASGGGTINAVFFARIFVPAGKAITGAALVVTAAGTLGAGGENSFGVYDDSGNFIASTPSDNTLWSAMGWRGKSFASPIPAQSSDRFVYVSPVLNGYSGVSIAYTVILNQINFLNGYGGQTKRRSFYTNSTTPSWPTTIDVNTFGTGDTGYIPLIALA